MSKPSSRQWLHPHKLEYVPLNAEMAVLRVVAGLNRGMPLPAAPVLVAGAPHRIVRAPVLGSVTHRPSRRMRTADHLLWRVTFALPIEVLECPETLFALVARDHMPTRLPRPELSSIEELCRHWELGARGPSLISGLTWRRAAALGTTVAVAGSSVLPPAMALADGPAHRVVAHHAAVLRFHKAPAPAVSARPGRLVVAQRVSGQTGESTHVDLAKQAAEHLHRHHRHHRHHRTVEAKPTNSTSITTSPAPSQSSGGASGSGSPAHVLAPHTSRHWHHRDTAGRTIGQGGGSGLSTISPAPPAGLIGTGPHSSGGAHHRTSHHHSRTAHGQWRHHHGHHAGGMGSRPAFSGGAALPSLKPHPSAPPRPTSTETQPVATPTPSALSSSGTSFLTTGMGMSAGEVALLSHLSGLYVKGLQPPAFLIPIYKKAGQRFHIPWQVLAAINSIETNYGRDLHISSAGAVGWMQFMPSTWREYGLSVTGNGPPNPYDPTDAIFSAARYLAANGAPHHLRKAIFAYNHAVWYVDSVMWRAGIISDHVQGIRHLGGYALPLDGKYMRTFGRTDDGLDIEDAPDGAAVYSITPGVVTAVASDPRGSAPTIR